MQYSGNRVQKEIVTKKNKVFQRQRFAQARANLFHIALEVM